VPGPSRIQEDKFPWFVMYLAVAVVNPTSTDMQHDQGPTFVTLVPASSFSKNTGIARGPK
jgi:hypothetical protein